MRFTQIAVISVFLASLAAATPTPIEGTNSDAVPKFRATCGGSPIGPKHCVAPQAQCDTKGNYRPATSGPNYIPDTG
ncbi:hypothetical protein BJY04DRAFT_221600 [Aspergillus karnatakaensis]|uniref:uncharacterized protein n=1 Tax=Aspergillus karnatakaensis TaxID=1810916 RepID=UPI003CCCCCA7